MSSHKKAQKPKRLFSKKNQARRAPPILHSERKAWEPSYIGEFDDLADLDDLDIREGCYDMDSLERLDPRDLPDLHALAPLAPPDTNPDDVNEFGMLKLSVVLKHFVAPYLDQLADGEEMESFYQLASIAWNLALHPELDVHSMAWDLLTPEIERGSLSLKEAQSATKTIEDMAQRKNDFFENDRRSILDLEVTPLGGKDFYLRVVSGLT
ncbi:MAG: hypothetical protein P4L85_08530 [Paludisphaera borealis]|uniref:hypothetical protein n=1 Tax=Paludisphaera borealis TaxID=1387353 RepID=UPI00283D75AC|nr:hypothetical protein [Paludisphaera borealis]MDR3619381.1 hypothetical protein [Paludisphaera borealis]